MNLGESPSLLEDTVLAIRCSIPVGDDTHSGFPFQCSSLHTRWPWVVENAA